MSKIVEPKGYHIRIEISGHIFVRDGIDTAAFGKEVFNDVVEHGGVDHMWLMHGKPTRPGSTVEEYTRVVLKADQSA